MLAARFHTARQWSAAPGRLTGFVRCVQIEKFTAGVGHAANFGDALLEAGLVASGVVANQFAIPPTHKKLRAC